MVTKTRSKSRLRVTPLTDAQKLQMIRLRIEGVPAATVASRYRITVRSLAAYHANFTRGCDWVSA